MFNDIVQECTVMIKFYRYRTLLYYVDPRGTTIPLSIGVLS